MRLDNQIMPGSGSRRFAAFRAVGGYLLLKQLVSELPGARIVGYVEGITEMWLDFDYRGHMITINDQFGEYWFFVRDSTTPEQPLEEIVSYFELTLPKRDQYADDVHDAWATGGAILIATLGILVVRVTHSVQGFGLRVVFVVALLIVSRVALGRLIPIRASSSGTKKPATENDGEKPQLCHQMRLT